MLSSDTHTDIHTLNTFYFVLWVGMWVLEVTQAGKPHAKQFYLLSHFPLPSQPGINTNIHTQKNLKNTQTLDSIFCTKNRGKVHIPMHFTKGEKKRVISHCSNQGKCAHSSSCLSLLRTGITSTSHHPWIEDLEILLPRN